MNAATTARSLVERVLADDDTAAPVSPAVDALAFRVKRFVLRLLIERAGRVVPTRESMPVLKNLRFEIISGRLCVTATDTELTMIAATELVDVTTPGTAYFPAKRLADIIRTAEGDTARIVVKGYTATITVGRTTWQLKLATGADWPPTPIVTPDVGQHTIDRVAFLAALNHVRYAAARDSRTSLMMIDVRDGRMTACDGVRLQQVHAPELPDCQIPIGAVDDLARLLGDTEVKTFTLAVTNNTLTFTVGADTLIVRRLTAKPPDVESQILRPVLTNNQRLTVDRIDLINAVKRVRINADQTTSAIILTLNPASGDRGANVTISTCDAQANTATETVDATWAGDTRTVVVHHAFLLDALAVIRQPTVTIDLGTDTKTRPSAILLRDDNDNYGVIPQMRADWVSQ